MNGETLFTEAQFWDESTEVQAWLMARIGMVTGAEEESEDPSIWQRPSKIPPGSMTIQGE